MGLIAHQNRTRGLTPEKPFAYMRKFITILNLLIKTDQLWENKMSA